MILKKKTDVRRRNIKLHHIKESIKILKRVLNDEKPYPNLDREGMIREYIALYLVLNLYFCNTEFEMVLFQLILKLIILT